MITLSQADASNLFRTEPAQYLDVGVGQVAYRRVGSGPDVLFVHGWPVSGATFRKLLPYLADHVTCHVLDLPGAGSSRFSSAAELSVATHISSVRAVVDQLGLDSVAAVGHDSGGLIARHALAGDPRLRSMGLINTEQDRGLSWRFKLFLATRHLPGMGAVLRWVCGQPGVRRNSLAFGSAFADSSLVDGEFAEFFLGPLHSDGALLDATMKLLKSFEMGYVDGLAALHRRIECPVRLVWGNKDPFFPLAWAKEMVDTFPNADLTVIPGAGLFSHEEQPAEVAEALLPILVGNPALS